MTQFVATEEEEEEAEEDGEKAALLRRLLFLLSRKLQVFSFLVVLALPLVQVEAEEPPVEQLAPGFLLTMRGSVVSRKWRLLSVCGGGQRPSTGLQGTCWRSSSVDRTSAAPASPSFPHGFRTLNTLGRYR